MSIVPPDDASAVTAARRYRDPLLLYEIVAEVALLAAAGIDPFADPRDISQRAWSDARHQLEDVYGPIPVATEVCRQLADVDGKPFPWRELLDLVFSDRDIRSVHTQRTNAPDNPDLNERHVFYALRRVAEVRQQSSLTPDQYTFGRNALILKERAASRKALTRLLPTRAQIVVVASRTATASQDPWDRALEVAGLAPRPTRAPGSEQRRIAIPFVDLVIHCFLAQTTPRRLPTYAAARAYASDAELQVQPLPLDVSWLAVLAEATEILQSAGHQVPPFDPEAADSIEWELPEFVETSWRISRTQVIEHMLRFSQWLNRQPRGFRRPTVEAHRRFADSNPGEFATSTVTRHGSIASLVREALRPDALARAAEVDRVHRPYRRVRRYEGGRTEAGWQQLADSEIARRVVAAIGRRETASVRELGEELSLSTERVGHAVRALRRSGQIEPTESYGRSQRQRYRLVGSGAEPSSDVEREQMLRSPWVRLALLHLRDEGSTSLRGLMPIVGAGSKSTVRTKLNRLREHGLVEKVKVGHNDVRYRVTELGRTIPIQPPSTNERNRITARHSVEDELRDAILSALAEAPAAPSELAHLADGKPRRIYYVMNKLADQGFVEKRIDGRRRICVLTPKGEAARPPS